MWRGSIPHLALVSPSTGEYLHQGLSVILWMCLKTRKTNLWVITIVQTTFITVMIKYLTKSYLCWGRVCCVSYCTDTNQLWWGRVCYLLYCTEPQFIIAGKVRQLFTQLPLTGNREEKIVLFCGFCHFSSFRDTVHETMLSTVTWRILLYSIKYRISSLICPEICLSSDPNSYQVVNVHWQSQI